MKTLYIHIPFCAKKCFYCSFVVSIGQEQRIDSYIDSLEQEMLRYKDEHIKSIYIGGGTPTLMNKSQLQKLFKMIHKYFIFSNNIEWTIEANPDGLKFEQLRVLQDFGVNRISLGVQTFHDGFLKYLGRNHDAQSARQAFKQLREVGFDNISLDLMISFPQQTMDQLKDDVKALIELESEHLSLYSLTIDQNSKFYAQNVQLNDNQKQAEQYEYVCHALNTAGFRQYEVSNFSKPLKESRHNINYWEGGEYIGLGIGAHSYLDNKRFWNITVLTEYIARIQKGLTVIKDSEELLPADQMNEVILFGLRMNQGINIQNIQKHFNVLLDDERLEKIKGLVEEGFLIEEENCLRTSLKGRLVLDELCAQLI